MVQELVPSGGWADEGAPRDDWAGSAPPNGTVRILRGLSRRFGREEVPEVFTALARSPALFWPWLVFASRLMPYGRLSPVDRETVILRTAWRCRSRYEWAQHVSVGLSVGMRDDDIVGIARGPATGADARVGALLAMCDELVDDRRVSDATWSALARRYDPPRLVELVILAGHYQMLAGFLNTLRLPLEPQVTGALEAFHRRIDTGAGS